MTPFSVHTRREPLATFEISSPKIAPFNIVIGGIIAAVTLLVITLVSWRIGSVCLRRYHTCFRNATAQTNTITFGGVFSNPNTNSSNAESIARPVPSLSRHSHSASSSQLSIPPPYDTRSPPAYDLAPINSTANEDEYWRRLSR